jgi:hypothetical protein
MAARNRAGKGFSSMDRREESEAGNEKEIIVTPM